MGHRSELQAVVVGSDPAVIESIVPGLSEMGIVASIHPRKASALRTLPRQKIDAFFVDRESDPELSVLTQMRFSPSSRRAVAFTIVPEHSSLSEASRVSDFIFRKPLNSVSIGSGIRSAYGTVLEERKRYFRQPLRVSIHLADSTYRRFLGETINISQTGIALECAAPFAVGEIVQLEFYLPGTPDKMNCKAQIMWRGVRGKAGLKFTSVNAADRERLRTWIEKHFDDVATPRPTQPSPSFLSCP